MPGMNSGVNINDPTVVAAFKAALLHQGLIALVIFAVLGLAWLSVRAWLPFAQHNAPAPAGTPAPATAGTPAPEAAGPPAPAAAAGSSPVHATASPPVHAEPAWRQVLRIGF